MPTNQAPRAFFAFEQCPERTKRTGGVDALNVSRTRHQRIVDIRHAPAFVAFSIGYLGSPLALQIMVAKDRIERHLLGIHLFEFTDPLWIINAGDAMLNEVV